MCVCTALFETTLVCSYHYTTTTLLSTVISRVLGLLTSSQLDHLLCEARRIDTIVAVHR